MRTRSIIGELGELIYSAGKALKLYLERSGTPLGLVARQADIPVRFVWDLAKFRVPPAEYYLRICALIHIDPATGEPANRSMPVRRGQISWPYLAAGLSGRMQVEELTLRRIAEASGLPIATISRALSGSHVLSLTSFLDLCRFLDRHPNEWTVGEVQSSNVEQPLKHADPVEVSP